MTHLYQFTHTDLDGGGCAVLTGHTILSTDADIIRADYQDIDSKLKKFLDTHRDDKEDFILLLTDICPKEETSLELDRFQNEIPRCRLHLFDHHKTSSWVQRFPWAQHDTGKCGTLLYFDWLVNNGYIDATDTPVKQFAELVDVYDRWLLDDERRSTSEDLNRLFFFLGFDAFVSSFSIDPLAHESPEYVKITKTLTRNQEAYIDRVIQTQCVGEFMQRDAEDNRLCALVADDNISSLCHEALSRFPELDYVVCVSPMRNQADLRSRQGQVDVSEIAKRCGGGGHPTAAGFPVDVRGTILLLLKGVLWKK